VAVHWNVDRDGDAAAREAYQAVPSVFRGFPRYRKTQSINVESPGGGEVISRQDGYGSFHGTVSGYRPESVSLHP
jgi:hypothetical protein